MSAAFPQARFLGVSFALASEEEALAAIRQEATGATFRFVVTPNVDHVVRLHRADPAQSQIRAAVDAAWMTLCDSRILAMLARWSGLTLPLVPGSDLTARLLGDPRFAGLHGHVIGGTEQTFAELQLRFPQLKWSQFIPGYGVLNDATARQAIGASIVAAGGDVVFMAIGFPQSEVVCAEVAQIPGARGVGLCIGASLEFLTGEKARAPRLVQRMKLEWLFRLLSEPRRLWRRYLVEGPKIFAIWLRARSGRQQ